MDPVQSRFKEFNSVKGYFLSDRKALAYIKINFDFWDTKTLNSKLGVLGLKQFVPDYKYRSFLQTLVESNIKQVVISGRLSIFEAIVHKYENLRRARFIVSALMCAHRPDHFPIWDDRKTLISRWEKMEEDFSYETLKQNIDGYKTENRLNSLDYFYFNKLLWYCE